MRTMTTTRFARQPAWLPLAALLALGSLGSGCTDNAVLELEVDLPANTTGTDLYAFIQVRTDELGFDVPWSGADPVDGFLLSPTERSTQPISIVADAADFERDVRVRATFCSAPRCDGFGDDRAAESRLEIEHPFYSLSRTNVMWRIETVPAMTDPAPVFVERCSVAGCRDGTTSDHCRMDGTHFCE